MKKLLLALICTGPCALSATTALWDQLLPLLPTLHEQVSTTITEELEKNETLAQAVTSHIDKTPGLSATDRTELVGGAFDVLGEQIADQWLMLVAVKLLQHKQFFKSQTWWSIIGHTAYNLRAILSEISSQQASLTAIVIERLQQKYTQIPEDQVQEVGKSVTSAVMRTLPQLLLADSFNPTRLSREVYGYVIPVTTFALGNALILYHLAKFGR